MEVPYPDLNRPIKCPRGETADDIFTVGNARPLDHPLQHATTAMSRWLPMPVRILDAREAT